MQLLQFRTDGEIDVTPLALVDATRAKLTSLALVGNPGVSGVYRIQFVDEMFDRVSFDTYDALLEPVVGAVMYAGAS